VIASVDTALAVSVGSGSGVALAVSVGLNGVLVISCVGVLVLTSLVRVQVRSLFQIKNGNLIYSLFNIFKYLFFFFYHILD